MFKTATLLFLYTESPLHVGSGSSLGTVDLPIQRERHTNLPMIQSTGIKGKLRSAFESNGLAEQKKLLDLIFGPDSANASDHAGALSPGDGRILLFPVRSLAGVFAWITCPLVINRLIRDLSLTLPTNPQTFSILAPKSSEAKISQLDPTQKHSLVISNAVVLEEFTFTASPDPEIQKLAHWLAEYALPNTPEYSFWREKLKTDLVVVSDDVFKDFCQFSTDVVSRTKLDPEKKTVENGALWTEENLPADALLYTPLFASNPRISKPADIPEGIRAQVENAKAILATVASQLETNHTHLQLGGNETVGRGIVATRILQTDSLSTKENEQNDESTTISAKA
jgi:CRISPR-associated protein Cmr4